MLCRLSSARRRGGEFLCALDTRRSLGTCAAFGHGKLYKPVVLSLGTCKRYEIAKQLRSECWAYCCTRVFMCRVGSMREQVKTAYRYLLLLLAQCSRCSVYGGKLTTIRSALRPLPSSVVVCVAHRIFAHFYITSKRCAIC